MALRSPSLKVIFTPCENFVVGIVFPSSRRDLMSALQANEPSATYEVAVLLAISTSRVRYGAQVSRSSIVGLLSGGAHLTAHAMRVSISSCPSLMEVLVGIVARPARCSDP